MEWSTPGQGEAIRQGDILMERPARGAQPAHVSIVVTADCDIAQDKFGTHLACLRVLWYEDYVRRIWADGERQKLMTTHGGKAAADLRGYHTAQLGHSSQMTDDRALDWLATGELTDIAEALAVPAPLRDKFLREFGPIQTGLREMRLKSTAFEACVALRTSVLPEDRAAAVKALLTKASKVGKLPDDVFFLPGLPDYEASSAIVMLRELVPVNIHDVVRVSSEAVSPRQRVRVGRLMSPYKYALTQAFGHLYSRIGMPTEYEARRDNAKANILHCGWT